MFGREITIDGETVLVFCLPSDSMDELIRRARAMVARKALSDQQALGVSEGAPSHVD